MKTVGIIGGIGPESTVEYYRKIISSYLQHDQASNYPQIIINSINMTKMLNLIRKGELEEVAEYLATEVNRLEAAGAEFGAIASNTPHIVFNRICDRAQLPLISIVEATCQEVLALGIEKVALFGTRFTMQGGFYDEVLTQKGIEVVSPKDGDQNFIHEKYMGELVKGIILDEIKTALVGVAKKMKQRQDIEGLILGGTELPLILQPGDVPGVRILDTTEIHVASIIKRLI